MSVSHRAIFLNRSINLRCLLHKIKDYYSNYFITEITDSETNNIKMILF